MSNPKKKVTADLATFLQRPLKPMTIWRVEATMRAPCIPRIIFSNLCIFQNLVLQSTLELLIIGAKKEVDGAS